MAVAIKDYPSIPDALPKEIIKDTEYTVTGEIPVDNPGRPGLSIYNEYSDTFRVVAILTNLSNGEVINAAQVTVNNPISGVEKVEKENTEIRVENGSVVAGDEEVEVYTLDGRRTRNSALASRSLHREGWQPHCQSACEIKDIPVTAGQCKNGLPVNREAIFLRLVVHGTCVPAGDGYYPNAFTAEITWAVSSSVRVGDIGERELLAVDALGDGEQVRHLQQSASAVAFLGVGGRGSGSVSVCHGRKDASAARLAGSIAPERCGRRSRPEPLPSESAPVGCLCRNGREAISARRALSASRRCSFTRSTAAWSSSSRELMPRLPNSYLRSEP